MTTGDRAIPPHADQQVDRQQESFDKGCPRLLQETLEYPYHAVALFRAVPPSAAPLYRRGYTYNDSLLQRDREGFMQHCGAVFDGLTAQAFFRHDVIDLLDVRASQRLKLDSADLRLDVILDAGLIMQICCRLDFISSEGVEPFIQPLSDGRFLGRQICSNQVHCLAWLYYSIYAHICKRQRE